MAREGIRTIPDAEHKLAHELADCLWAILVLARIYGVDLEQAFVQTMDDLEDHITALRPT
jgi:NTP pyrophosphatase (non-canonical NTP hydrolase)